MFRQPLRDRRTLHAETANALCGYGWKPCGGARAIKVSLYEQVEMWLEAAHASLCAVEIAEAMSF